VKHRPQYAKILLFTLGLAVVALAGFAVARPSVSGAPAAVALERPAFLDDAGTNALVEKIQDEAGISVYFKTTNPIDLSLIRGQYRTIELETTDFIIGSVPVTGYYEHYDPHVYVHRDGWIMAYYLKNDPAAKIVDPRSGTLDSDKLKVVINQLAAVVGTFPTGITYYDFRFPNANRLLIVAEDGNNGRDFYLTLPVDYVYSELSFATDRRAITVDNRTMSLLYSEGDHDENAYGVLTLVQMAPGVRHSISIPDSYYSYNRSYFGAVVIIYKVP